MKYEAALAIIAGAIMWTLFAVVDRTTDHIPMCERNGQATLTKESK